MGVTCRIHIAVVCFSTLLALNNVGELKRGPSLHSPWSSGTLATMFTGSFSSALKFLGFVRG